MKIERFKTGGCCPTELDVGFQWVGLGAKLWPAGKNFILTGNLIL
jgi:hypothetical protein